MSYCTYHTALVPIILLLLIHSLGRDLEYFKILKTLAITSLQQGLQKRQNNLVLVTPLNDSEGKFSGFEQVLKATYT